MATSRIRSDWELAEAAERRRHAVWLVRHGAERAEVVREMGVSFDKLNHWVRRDGCKCRSSTR